MKEVVCVNLENDMDLILAHKRVMKLCELTGFSLILQTTIATAVSEVARCAIEYGKSAQLRLGISAGGGKKTLKAVIGDTRDFSPRCKEAIQYAKRLVDDVHVMANSKEFAITLQHPLAYGRIITDARLDAFIDYFKSEPPISAYDELRRKNLLLQELAEKLQESESDFRILTDSLPLMMFSTNNGGIITYANKWLKDFFGQVPRDLTGSSWQSLLYAGDYSTFNKEVQNAISTASTFTGQYRFAEKSSDTYLWHIFSMIPLRNDKDIIIRWIGFIFDINAQKQIEQTLKDNRELKAIQRQLYENQAELQDKIVKLNRSNYELEQFAHLASHDLQEPLRKLLFYSDVLKNRYPDQIDPYGQSILNNMGSAVVRMKELINDLLSYSELQHPNLAFETVDLNALVQEIIKDLDIPVRERHATIEFEELPTLQGNPIRLRQLFANLVSNALKYSRDGIPPVVKIFATTEDEHVCIHVRDNGIGFAEEYREKIFGLFERLHTRDQFPGTGIGLSICRKIAELHHGSITAVSVPGDHAEFIVKFPMEHHATPHP